MSGKSYAELYKRIRDLIGRGTKVADERAGTPEARIHKWTREAEECLSQLEDKTALSTFRHLQQKSEFIVGDDFDPDSISKSAYSPQWTDARTGATEGTDLVDFRFDYLEQINGVLKSAATKLELEGHSLPTLGEELRAARLHAGHSQQKAAEQIGDKCDHKYISEWETGKRKPRPDMAKKIRDYIKKTNKL